MWWRETTCYSTINGKVKITHAHSSVPFKVENGMASVDLKPDIDEQKPQKEELGNSPSEIAKRLYQAFQNQERNVLENLFSADFTFSSPDD